MPRIWIARARSAGQQRLGDVEQVQRAVEVAEAADDHGERHLQRRPPARRPGLVGEGDPGASSKRRPRAGRAHARRSRSPTGVAPARRSQSAGTPAAGAPPHEPPTGRPRRGRGARSRSSRRERSRASTLPASRLPVAGKCLHAVTAIVTMVGWPRDDLPPPRRPPSSPMHPAPLNDLTEIFDRRRIAVGIDSSGQVVLARPDNVLAEVGSAEQRESVASTSSATTRSKPPGRKPRQREASAVRDRPTARCRTGDGQRRGSLDVDPCSAGDPGTRRTRTTGRGRTEPRLPRRAGREGKPARSAGVVGRRDGLPRQCRRSTKPDANGVVRKVMLSTAEPAEEPRFLRRRLNIEGRRRPQILVLDTGLRTVVEDGTRRPEHVPRLLHRARGVARRGPAANGTIPIDDEDEPDDDDDRDARLRGRARHVHRRRDRPALPRRRGPHVWRAVELRRRRRRRRDRRSPGRTRRHRRTDRHRGDELRRLLRRRRPGDLRDQPAQAARRQARHRRRREPGDVPPVLPRRPHRGEGRWRRGGWRASVVLQLRRLGRRLRSGVDVVSTFFSFSEDLALFPDLDDLTPREFKGWACWSGTSFSAPKVAAVLAQEMYLNLDTDGSDLITARGGMAPVDDARPPAHAGPRRRLQRMTDDGQR